MSVHVYSSFLVGPFSNAETTCTKDPLFSRDVFILVYLTRYELSTRKSKPKLLSARHCFFLMLEHD